MNRKFRRFAAIAAAAVMSVGAFAFVGCNDGDKNNGETEKPPVVQESKVSKITVTTRPRLKYIVGETFDKTGMVVTATYEDGTSKEVTDYTVDKTAPLTVKDSSVMIMYKGKMAFLPLTVGIELQEKLTIPNSGNAVYTVEAEHLDYSYCENSNTADAHPGAEASKDSSGGYSMGALAVPGNMFGFKVNCEEEVNIDLVIRASAVSDDIFCDDCMSVFVNDVSRRSEHMLTWGGDGAWWDWEHVYYRDITLNKGMNEIYLRMNTQRVPNFDCFYIVTSPTGTEELGPDSVFIPPMPEYEKVLDIESAESESYLIEAESLDFSLCNSSNKPGERPNFELPLTETSGGKCVSSLAVPGNRFGFAVESTVEADIAIVARVSNGNPETQVLDDIVQMKWNDTVLETNYTLVWETDNWHDWKDVTVYGLKLTEGTNYFDFFVKTTSAPNVDCFTIIVSPEEPVGPPAHQCADVCETCGKCTSECTDEVCSDKCDGHEPALEYEKKIDVTDAGNATYLVEAESLDLSKCTHSSGSGRPNFENPTTETSGGRCVSSLSFVGNKLGFTVSSAVEATANLTLRVSSGAPGEQYLDNLVKLNWNNVDYYTGYVAPDPTGAAGWHHWESAIMYNLPLAIGNNTFFLEVVGNACPNIDCFILEVSPDNSGVEIPERLEYAKKLEITSGENAEYKVEAETLDYSKCKNSNNQNILPGVENPTTETSGGQSIGSLGVAGNKFGFTVSSTVACKIRISLRVSSGNANAQVLDDIMKITWNGVECKTGYTVSAVVDGAWHVWETAVITVDLELLAENNVFIIEITENSAPNFDCFIFEVNPVTEPVPEVHECADVCETCGKCTSECTDEVCTEKCSGHEPVPEIHECADVCETCGKCTSECTDEICTEKCGCGEVNPPEGGDTQEPVTPPEGNETEEGEAIAA